jgi:hypothetical protein
MAIRWQLSLRIAGGGAFLLADCEFSRVEGIKTAGVVLWRRSAWLEVRLQPHPTLLVLFLPSHPRPRASAQGQRAQSQRAQSQRGAPVPSPASGS